MNIWDSVHRGLEKASNEAGRIAKTQRLRSAIDKMGRQMQEREAALFNSVMHLFSIGALNQSELLPLCQEIAQMHQQLAQLQGELQQLHNQQPATDPSTPTPPTQPASTAVNPYIFPTSGTPYPDVSSDLPANHPYAPTATPIPTPPPPPGVSDRATPSSPLPPGSAYLATNMHQTQPMPSGGTNPPLANMLNCPQCGIATLSSGAFCQNCGASLGRIETHQSTIQGQNPPASPSLPQQTLYANVEQVGNQSGSLAEADAQKKQTSSSEELSQEEEAQINDTPPPAN